ncbi:IclR family transcriptional regulator [Sphingobacterium anhuiense]|uniref:IclR family transcriptional regulator n=1 Tax=Sphingobacterium anhuiense TaxID=493780 RepID=UPI003C2F35BC
MIQSVKRVFDILEYIAANGNLVRLSDIAAATGLQNTTVHNFLNTLKEMGYVEQDDISPRYRIATKINQLLVQDIPLFQIKATLRPMLENLSRQTQETSYLAIQLGSYFRYELKSEPSRSVRISLELGKELEMKRTAIGKVFMAYSADLTRWSTQDMNDQDITRQLAQLAEIKEKGYAVDLEEYEKDLNCVAIPYIRHHRILAVIGVSGPAFRFKEQDMVNVAERIKSTLAGLA